MQHVVKHVRTDGFSLMTLPKSTRASSVFRPSTQSAAPKNVPNRAQRERIPLNPEVYAETVQMGTLRMPSDDPRAKLVQTVSLRMPWDNRRAKLVRRVSLRIPWDDRRAKLVQRPAPGARRKRSVQVVNQVFN